MGSDLDARAERLRAAVLLLGVVYQSPRDALSDTVRDRADAADAFERWLTWCDADPEDKTLALACLQAEYELRDMQWQALELLCHARSAPAEPERPTPAGSVGRFARLRRLLRRRTATQAPPAETVRVERAEVIATASYVLGWNLPAPAGRE